MNWYSFCVDGLIMSNMYMTSIYIYSFHDRLISCWCADYAIYSYSYPLFLGTMSKCCQFYIFLWILYILIYNESIQAVCIGSVFFRQTLHCCRAAVDGGVPVSACRSVGWMSDRHWPECASVLGSGSTRCLADGASDGCWSDVVLGGFDCEAAYRFSLAEIYNSMSLDLFTRGSRKVLTRGCLILMVCVLWSWVLIMNWVVWVDLFYI